jgi:ribosomal protein S18 acetylase RimI-like enzyme
MGGSGVESAGDGPDGSSGSLRPGRPADAAVVASLHSRLISDGFLSSLGPRFLQRLYGRIVHSNGSFLLVVEARGTVVGFIAGSVALGRLYRSFLLRDGLTATCRAPLRILTALPRVFETLRHGGTGTEGGGELLAVAVDPGSRGRHVGRRLVEGFLGELERRGVSSAQVVVGADNAAAIALYRQAGFAPARTFELHRGTRSVLMQAAVPNGATPGTRTAP